jgi:hypothetical protein
MNNIDIDFSNKASWEHSWRELFVVLGKRILSLPSKIIGFKPLCLSVATWLLVQGHIRDWIWFCVLVIVLFGIVGLKVITRWKVNNSSNEDYGRYDGSGIVG